MPRLKTPPTTPATSEIVAGMVATHPCKPRAASTEADRMPAPQRPGSNYIREFPSIVGGYRVWPDGRKEPV